MTNKNANQQYTERVTAGDIPIESLVPLDDAFQDARGQILNLLLTSISSVARITSAKRTVRANHYHLTDWHYTYVEKGEVLYFERSISDTLIPTPKRFVTGSMFFTPSMREHAMLFPVDTTIFTFAKNTRSHSHHEADVRRVEFITPDLIERYLKPEL